MGDTEMTPEEAEKYPSQIRDKLLQKCMSDIEARKDLFHRLWSNAGSTKYDEDQWMVFEAILLAHGVI